MIVNTFKYVSKSGNLYKAPLNQWRVILINSNNENSKFAIPDPNDIYILAFLDKRALLHKSINNYILVL